MPVLSISMTSELLSLLDDYVERAGYSSRSEAIRLSIRDTLSQFALQQIEKGDVVSTVTVIFETDRHNLSANLIKLRHRYEESIFGNMHLHVGEGYCVEIFFVRNNAKEVLEFVSRVRGLKGIRAVNYMLTPLE